MGLSAHGAFISVLSGVLPDCGRGCLSGRTADGSDCADGVISAQLCDDTAAMANAALSPGVDVKIATDVTTTMKSAAESVENARELAIVKESENSKESEK